MINPGVRCDFQRMIENERLEKNSEDHRVVLCSLPKVEDFGKISFKIKIKMVRKPCPEKAARGTACFGKNRRSSV